MEKSISPTEAELQELRDKIQEAKRNADYQKLKDELKDIVFRANNTPNEFEGMMQVPDTERILKSKRANPRFFELLFDRLRGMLSIRPVIGNVIALLIAGLLFYYLFHEIGEKWFLAYQRYFSIGIQLFAAIQIIKSGTRSLILPFLALVIGGIASHSLHVDQTLFHFSKSFYEHLMIVGIIGLAMSVLSID